MDKEQEKKWRKIWKEKKEFKEEQKKKVINFIDFLMEEYDISIIDLE